MRLIELVTVLVIVQSSVAQEDLTVLKPDEDGVSPRKMLYTYLQEQAQKHFEVRRAVVAALKTPEDFLSRQQDLKSKFIESLGGFPDKTPLNPQVVGQLHGDGYRVEKIIYESRPNHHVTAVFYLPEAKPPFPGVLVPCGHSANGKAAEAYQRACILMAKNGLAVLCYDPIGQGERSQLLDENGKPAIPGSTTEHTLVGIGALLVGQSAASYRIWDGIRSLDYLASRPEVDPHRLGCTGNSGGGTLTAYLMALDDRIVAAVPSCYITSLERLFATIGPQDAEQNITGQVEFGMEHADYVTMRAPRPTLICVGTQDYFDIQGAWTTFREAKQLYGLLGHGERVDLFEYNDKHGFSQPRREASMRWMRRWLLGMDDTPVEAEFPIFKDEELQCTRSGQVLWEFRGRSAFHLNLMNEKELYFRRAIGLSENNSLDIKGHRRALTKSVRRLLALPSEVKPAKLEESGTIERTDYLVRKMSFETEPGIRVSGLGFVPGKPADEASWPMILYLQGDGKATDAGVGGPIEQLVKAGHRVLALDLRGMGETAPSIPAATGDSYFGTDSKEAFLALHLNRPLLGQRVRDLLSVIQSIAKDSPGGFHVIAIGSAGPIALHAASLDDRIKQITIERSVISWSAVVRTPISYDQLTNVVPGVLKHYDLPELAATLAPRPLTIRHPVDPAGMPVDQSTLESAYGFCKEVYGQLKATNNLILQARP